MSIPDVVQDPKNTTSGQDVIVYAFSQHPAVNPLTQLALQLILPRPIVKVDWKNPPANAPKVDELAFSGPASTLMGDPTAAPRSYPLMAAVEQKAVPGVANARGSMRMIVVGDSFFSATGRLNPVRTGISPVTPRTGCWIAPYCWKASGRGPSRNTA